MAKQFINEVSGVIVRPKFFETYDVYSCKNIKNDKNAIIPELNKINVLDKVEALFHYSRNEHFAVFKRGVATSKTMVLDGFKVDSVNHFSDDIIPLNIVLSMAVKDDNNRFSSRGFYHVLKEGKNQVITLEIRFKKDSDLDTIYLQHNIQTFTDFDILKENSKYKDRTDFYVLSNKQMIYVGPNYKKDEKLYLPCNSFYKSSHNSYDIFSIPGGMDKYDRDIFCSSSIFGVMSGFIMPELSKFSEYISFSFRQIEIEKYKDKKGFEKIKENVLNAYSKMNVNFVLENKKRKEEIDSVLKTLLDKKSKNFIPLGSFEISDELKSGYNIVLLNFSKDNDGKSDDFYDKTCSDIKNNTIVQHLVLEDLIDKNGDITVDKLKEPLLTCLQELLIKECFITKELPDCMKNILPTEKMYSFYLQTTDRDDENNEIIKYSKISLFDNKIVDYYVRVINDFSDDDDDLQYFSSNCFTIVDNSENVLRIYSTNFSVLPDFCELNKRITETDEKNKEIWSLSGLKDYLEIKVDEFEKEKQQVIKNLIENTEDFGDESIEMPLKEIRQKYFKNRADIAGDKTLNIIFEKLFGREVNVHLQGVDDADAFCSAFLGISYNDEFYAIGDYASIQQKIDRGIPLKRYEYEGDNILPEILPSLYVPFVRRNQLTVFPFPFKLLREGMILTEKKTEFEEQHEKININLQITKIAKHTSNFDLEEDFEMMKH